MSDRSNTSALAFLPACLALALLLRLPLAAWGSPALDGDESIVGLMARHIATGQALPVFFYGQTYGLSLPEAASAALFFKLFGVSPVSLHLGILLLWLCGTALFCLAARRLLPPAGYWIFGLALALCPAWLEWSFKARGFYAGGFLAAGLFTWLLARARDKGPRARRLHLLAGLVLGLTGHVHVLWCLVLAPVTAAWLVVARRLRGGLLLAGAALLSYGLLYAVYVHGDYSYWKPDLFSLQALPEVLLRMPGRLCALYREGSPLSQGFWTGFHLLGLLAGLWLVLQTRKAVYAGLFLSALALFAGALLMPEAAFHPRYLLPTSVPAAALAACAMAELNRRRPGPGRASLAFILLLMAGAALADGLALQQRVQQNRDMDAPVRKLVQELLDQGVRHVYVMDGQLQWQLMFFSEEKILARWTKPRDRVPALPLAVDAALLREQPVAVVGKKNFLESIRGYLKHIGRTPEEVHVAGPFFWVADPTPRMLVDMGFRLNPVRLLR